MPDDSAARSIAPAIEAELVAKGFPLVGPHEARLLVHYHLTRRTVTRREMIRGEVPAKAEK